MSRRAVLIGLAFIAGYIGLWVLIATAAPFAHFWRFYFVPAGEPWWKGAVWGNVLALWPSVPVVAVLGFLGYLFHQSAIAPLHAKIDELTTRHDEHAEHFKCLLDALDPGTETDSTIDRIADAVDLNSPGGLRQHRDEVLAAIAGTSDADNTIPR